MSAREPSEIVDAIVANLRAELEGRAVDVRAHDGEFLESGGKDRITTRSPGVLVACLGFPQTDERDYEPPAALAHFVAVCHARGPKSQQGQTTAGAVAMNLAGFVHGVVTKSLWPDASGENAVLQRAQRISSANEVDDALTNKGMRVWIVQWLQLVELPNDGDAIVASLNRLREINVTFSMGGAATPDESFKAEFP